MEPFNNPPQFQKEEDSKAYLTALNVFEIVVAIVAVVFAVLYYLYVWSPAQKEVAPVSPTIEITDAINAFNQNNFDKALENTDATLAGNPKNVTALLLKASTLAQRGSIEFKEKKYGEQAITSAKQALEIAATDTEKSEAWRIIGYVNEIMERYDDAFSAYDTAIKLNPKNALAISQEGHANQLFGNIKKARALYEQALKVDPSLEHALANYGRVLLQEGMRDEAEIYMKRVFKDGSYRRLRAEAGQILGVLSLYKGDFTAAKNYFGKAIAIDNNLASAWVGLAEAEYLTLTEDKTNFRNNIILIFQNLERATNINPNQTTAYLLAGKTLFLVGDKKQARGVLEKAIEILGKDISLGVIEKNDMRKTLNNELVKI